MFRKHELIPSAAMGRQMHLWRFGHFGPPLLVFPSASGMAHEWDAHGMVEALGDHLEAGRLKLYCAESNVAEAWTRREGTDPRWRIQRHKDFERYVVDELAPWIRHDCQSASMRLMTGGVSLGAFYAVNFTLKYPHVFHYALCMSGRYDVTWMTDGFASDDIYFNNPIAYVPNMHGEHLEDVRRNVHIALVCGQGKWEDGNIEDTHRLADSLGAKGIPHERDMWGYDVEHAWIWWQRQARFHLDRILPQLNA